ncbi:hypothetical protein [uncultured Clostridium sp.]|nr:hypothetical protein [uncultured Clostridium sp.]
MTPKELTALTVRDIANRREKADKEFYGYQKESGVRRKKACNVRYGGYRW